MKNLIIISVLTNSIILSLGMISLGVALKRGFLEKIFYPNSILFLTILFNVFYLVKTFFNQNAIPLYLILAVQLMIVLQRLSSKRKIFQQIDQRTVIFLTLSFLVRMMLFVFPKEELTLFSVLNLLDVGAFFSLSFFLSRKEREKDLEHYLFVQKTLEQKLFQSLKNSEVGSLLPGILHELSHPVMILNARLIQLLRLTDDELRMNEIRPLVSQLKGSCDRIITIIHNSREFIKLENNSKEEFLVKDLLQDMFIFWGQRLKNHGVSFRSYDLDELKLVAHRADIEQIFLTLIHMAFEKIEFLSDKWIEIRAFETEKFISLYFTFSLSDQDFDFPLEFELAKNIAEKNECEINRSRSSGHTSFEIKIPKILRASEGSIVLQ